MGLFSGLLGIHTKGLSGMSSRQCVQSATEAYKSVERRNRNHRTVFDIRREALRYFHRSH